MRIELTPAIVLHRRAWRDTSFLVEAFSREHGRVGLVAKGARRAKSRWRGLLEPMTDLRMSWTGRGELYTLTDVETRRHRALIGKALMAGFYASELILRLVAREDPNPPLYDSASAMLSALADGAPAIIVLRFFERDLLAAVGYGVPLEVTSSGDVVTAQGQYFYQPGGGLRGASGTPRDDEVSVPGSALQGLLAGRFESRTDVRAVRDLMQAAIAPHLGGRPLKSVQTLQAMQQFRAVPANGMAGQDATGETS